MHPWQYNNKAYHNNIGSIRRVADEVSAVDDGVGEVMAALKRLWPEENTIVIFAGDQGWMGGQNGFFGMVDHTRPIGASCCRRTIGDCPGFARSIVAAQA